MAAINKSRHEGRVAIVTGGAQGVGLGITRRLAAEGATLLVAQRSEDTGLAVVEALRADFGATAEFVAIDVTKQDQVEHMIATAVDQFGRLDILVNNAGGSIAKRLENHDNADMEWGLNLNFWSTFWAMKAAFPIMKAQRWGRIVNLASLNGVHAAPFTSQYNIAKEAVRALSRSAAVEWAEHEITCNVICPSAMTPSGEVYMKAAPEMFQAIFTQIPRGRMGDPEKDIGPVASFLSSEDSGHITGMTFFVDGGSHINGVQFRPAVD